ncbi:EEF1A lysine methyltransferase 1-like [Homarus americanus]|uniref:Protein-lysine N-methyltransferase Hamer_G002765 n=1 Tax=Homarus americanus TaxID=6706 RepID=A0A8J5MTD2_HOMAM|nr:EEF1A lysine methyltransferase 1-like [Homarus americanus]XP_042231384.1 EEF1A lysine methyltransferase 1-like [Homarus americanus]XP_042231385.1 EEF1A lysine methyltransferase 1-like [Homarus americanus]KAG7163565.1 EEF1A lysine methyltransferase 1-like [Homarus americanus]
MSSSESEDEIMELELSAETMGALMEYYMEQAEREQKLREIEEGDVPDSFEENWNMSQFWYSEETARSLAEECIRTAGNNGSIACVSAPTLYRTLMKMEHSCSVKVLEFDTRFSVYKDDFIFYDFKDPLGVPRKLHEHFDVIVADPPYLSDDCFTKTAITVKFLMKPDATIIVCTGSVMEELAERLLGVKKCQSEIKHENSLSNPFVCFANYNLDDHWKS